MARYSFLKIGNLQFFTRIFGNIITCLKQGLTFLDETTYIDLEFFHKSRTAAVAIATMTFQDGGYFGFKGI